MKSILSVCKIFLRTFLIVYLASSCSNIRVITITGINPNNHENLILRDKHGEPADTLKVLPGQTIKWKIKSEDILALDSLPLKDPTKASSAVLEQRPTKDSSSSNWTGKVKKTGLKAGDYEIYHIYWKDKNNQLHKYDPAIMVKNPCPPCN
jgi:hypothetical protein